MALLLKTLLIWLLVLAVPAQAAAAATMAFCGPGHHGGVAAGHDAGAAAHTHQGLEGQLAHGHSGVDADLAPASDAPAAAGPADAHKCSACASCCTVGAIFGAALTLPAPELAATVFSIVVPGVEAFTADGPDRPPRIFRA